MKKKIAKLKSLARKKRWYDGPSGTVLLSMLAGLFLKGLFLTIERFAEIFTSIS